MFNKEKLGLEKAFATEVVKIFYFEPPKILTPDILHQKALALRRRADSENYRKLTVAQMLRAANIDQLRAICKAGVHIWEQERQRGRGWDTDPLHILKSAIRDARAEADHLIEKIAGEV